jgi:hypothetical protein
MKKFVTKFFSIKTVKYVFLKPKKGRSEFRLFKQCLQFSLYLGADFGLPWIRWPNWIRIQSESGYETLPTMLPHLENGPSNNINILKKARVLRHQCRIIPDSWTVHLRWTCCVHQNKTGASNLNYRHPAGWMRMLIYFPSSHPDITVFRYVQFFKGIDQWEKRGVESNIIR